MAVSGLCPRALLRFTRLAPLALLAAFSSLGSARAEGSPADATRDSAALEAWLKGHSAGASHALTLPDLSGMRLTHWAASGGHLEVLKLLAQKGADPWDGTATPEERSSLHMACQSGHAPVVEWLLSEAALKLRSRGAFSAQEAANSRDKRETPCLHMAATAGQLEVLRAVVTAGADVGVVTKRSGTALHAAAAVGQSDAVSVLLEVGADPCARNSRGETPGARAREEEMEEVAEMLAGLEEAGGCGKAKKKGGKKGEGKPNKKGKKMKDKEL